MCADWLLSQQQGGGKKIRTGLANWHALIVSTVQLNNKLIYPPPVR